MTYKFYPEYPMGFPQWPNDYKWHDCPSRLYKTVESIPQWTPSGYREENGCYMFEVPGFEKEEIEVTIDKGTLQVNCKTKQISKDVLVYKNALSYTVNCSKEIQSASLKNGVLYVYVKQDTLEKQTIKIE